jgi:hypothetical protein
VPKRDDFKLSTEDGLVDPEWSDNYRGEPVDGPRVSLKVDGRGMSGWGKANQVVLVAEATGFFERLIRAKPRAPHGYLMRGMIAQNERKARTSVRAAMEAVVACRILFVTRL